MLKSHPTTPAKPLFMRRIPAGFLLPNLKVIMSDRYTVPDNENYEPGSDAEVLKNYLGIKEKKIIEQLEARELLRAEHQIFAMYEQSTRFTANDICEMHYIWLKNIYPIAGKYRSVSMSKDGFPFAAANRIPDSMLSFQKNYLSKYTPCANIELTELVEALAIVHVEFILIHPFREGNGRIGRMLAILMALQAGKPPLNFSTIDQTNNLSGYKRYINAIHAGTDMDYLPMQKIFCEILESSEP